MIVSGDKRRSDKEIREEIAGLMFAALISLDREINSIMKESGLSWKEGEWLEEAPDS